MVLPRELSSTALRKLTTMRFTHTRSVYDKVCPWYTLNMALDSESKDVFNCSPRSLYSVQFTATIQSAIYMEGCWFGIVWVDLKYECDGGTSHPALGTGVTFSGVGLFGSTWHSTPSPRWVWRHHLTTHSFCVFSRLRKLNFTNSFESSLVAFQSPAIAKFWCFRSLSLITLCTNYYSRNQA